MSLTYQLIIIGGLLAAGFALILKADSKFGWILVAASAVYGFYVVQPIIKQAQQPAGSGAQKSGYYK